MKTIALLYNSQNELDDWLERNKNFIVSNNRNHIIINFGYDESIRYISCRAKPDSVRQSLCGHQLSMYYVLGDSMYEAEALQFVASRVREAL